MEDFAGMTDEALVAETDQREAELAASVDALTLDPSPENDQRNKDAQKALVSIRSYLRRCGEAAGTRTFVTTEEN